MLDAIKYRRSVRAYRPDPVSEEQLREILGAGMLAPSASNGQPWDFIVLTERADIDAVHAVHPYSEMLREAPVCIVLCVKTDERGYYQQDAAAATENILLEAYNQGLGTCWMGVYPKPKLIAPITELLHIPEGTVPFCLIALGHPAAEQQTVDRFDERKIHYGKW